MKTYNTTSMCGLKFIDDINDFPNTGFKEFDDLFYKIYSYRKESYYTNSSVFLSKDKNIKPDSFNSYSVENYLNYQGCYYIVDSMLDLPYYRDNETNYVEYGGIVALTDSIVRFNSEFIHMKCLNKKISPFTMFMCMFNIPKFNNLDLSLDEKELEKLEIQCNKIMNKIDGINDENIE